jgi:hypothetical protein
MIVNYFVSGKTIAYFPRAISSLVAFVTELQKYARYLHHVFCPRVKN